MKFGRTLDDLVATDVHLPRAQLDEWLHSPGNIVSLRIALHAGPVYEFQDPITGDRTYGGSHVNRAARIEPITPPGQVYASEGFAALSAVRCPDSFVCEYAGQTPLAKG